MNSARASMSAARIRTLKSTTARTAHGPTAPSDVQATPPMKNAAHPSSASARVVGAPDRDVRHQRPRGEDDADTLRRWKSGDTRGL